MGTTVPTPHQTCTSCPFPCADTRRHEIPAKAHTHHQCGLSPYSMTMDSPSAKVLPGCSADLAAHESSFDGAHNCLPNSPATNGAQISNGCCEHVRAHSGQCRCSKLSILMLTTVSSHHVKVVGVLGGALLSLTGQLCIPPCETL